MTTDPKSFTPEEMREFLDMRVALRDHSVLKVQIEREAAPEWEAVQAAETWGERNRLDRIRCRKVLSIWRRIKP